MFLGIKISAGWNMLRNIDIAPSRLLMLWPADRDEKRAAFYVKQGGRTTNVQLPSCSRENGTCRISAKHGETCFVSSLATGARTSRSVACRINTIAASSACGKGIDGSLQRPVALCLFGIVAAQSWRRRAGWSGGKKQRYQRVYLHAVSSSELSSPPSGDTTTFSVPVRNQAQSVTLKRLMDISPTGSSLPQSSSAVLLLHDGPGLNCTCLEPLAWRLCAKAAYTCYMYDRLECGLPTRHGMRNSIGDMEEVIHFLHDRLCEQELHIVGHGLGGMLVMEALLRAEIWGLAQPGLPVSLSLPNLKSVTLIATASDTGLLRSEALRLYRSIKKDVGQTCAPSTFWSKHYRSGSGMIAEAYSETMWAPWYDCLLRGWRITEEELCKTYVQTTGGVPLLSLRGECDFVTAKCTEAWHAVSAAFSSLSANSRNTGSPRWFAEETLPSCGHNVHLQAPDACAEVRDRKSVV